MSRRNFRVRWKEFMSNTRQVWGVSKLDQLNQSSRNVSSHYFRVLLIWILRLGEPKKLFESLRQIKFVEIDSYFLYWIFWEISAFLYVPIDFYLDWHFLMLQSFKKHASKIKTCLLKQKFPLKIIDQTFLSIQKFSFKFKRVFAQFIPETVTDLNFFASFTQFSYDWSAKFKI